MVEKRSGGDPKATADAKAALQHLARDHARVPMPWDASANGGFSAVKPWMRANDDYDICNVQQQRSDKDSVLAFWKQMLTVRSQHADLLVHGDFDLLDEDSEKTFTFTKIFKGQKALVTLNFSAEEQPITLPEKSELLVGTVSKAGGSRLSAYEGRIYLLQ